MFVKLIKKYINDNTSIGYTTMVNLNLNKIIFIQSFIGLSKNTFRYVKTKAQIEFRKKFNS